MRIDRDRNALVIVDVQNDFCPRGALAVPEGDGVIDPINSITAFFRHIVLTQDWHPLGHVSFASSWPGRTPYEIVESEGVEQTLWPDHCIAGSHGASFHPDLECERAELIIRKGTQKGLDSYSALFENDRRTPTGLLGWLTNIRIETVFIAGLATDYCVLYSGMDLLRSGLDLVVIEDAVRGVGIPGGSIEAALGNLLKAGASFVASTELGGSP
jgi:nicotinamidase/pyrazinamidase